MGSDRTFPLTIRTPGGLVVRTEARSLSAEETTGRFGVRPGMEPLISALVPGLIIYRDEDGEHFVASGRGFLRATKDAVEVAVRSAIPCASLGEVKEVLLSAEAAERESELAVLAVLRSLEERLVRALLDEERAR